MSALNLFSFFVSFPDFLWLTSAFYGVIDLLSVLPYYLEVMFLQDTVSHSSNPNVKPLMILIIIYFSQYTLDFPFFACSVSCGCFVHFATTIQSYCERSLLISSLFNPFTRSTSPLARLRSCTSQYAVHNTPYSPLGSLSL